MLGIHILQMNTQWSSDPRWIYSGFDLVVGFILHKNNCSKKTITWTVILLYIIKASVYFQRRVHLPLCSGIFPLSGSVLVVNKVNPTIWLNTFLPACWQSTQWVLLLRWCRHCWSRVLQIQQTFTAWIMIMRKLYQSQRDIKKVGCVFCFWHIRRSAQLESWLAQ